MTLLIAASLLALATYLKSLGFGTEAIRGFKCIIFMAGVAGLVAGTILVAKAALSVAGKQEGPTQSDDTALSLALEVNVPASFTTSKVDSHSARLAMAPAIRPTNGNQAIRTMVTASQRHALRSGMAEVR